MDTKLTLRLKKSVIEKAKEYAQIHRISLSRLIENYLDTITISKREENGITPFVESLSGVIQLETDFDYKKEYPDFLIEKYK